MGRRGVRIKLFSGLFLLAIGGLFAYFMYFKDLIKLNDSDVKGDESIDCNVLKPQIKNIIESTALKRKWLLVGDNLPEEYTNLIIISDLENTSYETKAFEDITFEIEGSNISGELAYDEAQKNLTLKRNVEDLKPGVYSVKISSNSKYCSIPEYKEFTFNISSPVYVTWTMDWEGFDVEQKYLDSITNISKKYGVPITHFFNPYIYLNLSKTRSAYLTEWIKDRVQLGDSVGLHLHMDNKLVKAAGVKVQDSLTWGGWYKNGHDVPNSVYGYVDFKKIIMWSQAQFKANNLPIPTMYRGGAWFVDEENLRVLNDLGFVLDSSGRQKYIWGDNKLEGPWDLKSTTQPYQLNGKNQNVTANPTMKLWEVPNNGADSWSFTAEQMLGYFKDNYSGGINQDIKVVTYLSHPHWFNIDEPKIISLFRSLGKYTVVSDNGPVIFITLDNLSVLSDNN